MVIGVNQTGKCPHCKISNRFEGVEEFSAGGTSSFGSFNLIGEENRYEMLRTCRCTACNKIILFFKKQMIYPLGAVRTAAPKEVPDEIGKDFNEACLVESLSPKASAALARRCLQNMLHERKISGANLSKEIDIAMETLPSHLSKAIDAIRKIGIFAAHPIKSTNTREIVEVEVGEAEWILDVLEQLFDFYYVQPSMTQGKRDMLNARLVAAGKKEMK